MGGFVTRCQGALMKNILVLGAGRVAGPLIEYLLEQPGSSVHVASDTPRRAELLVGGHPRATASTLEVPQDSASLDTLIGDAAVVVSLLPAAYDVQVAERCIAHCKPVVTTNYADIKMRRLNDAAREAGVILLNEIGLDPGIDHMSAMRLIDQVHSTGGEVRSFRSYCGGIPAPDANDNPLGYKFSWSPRGLLLAGLRDARYKDSGKVAEVPSARLFAHHSVVWVEGLGNLEVYPNHDSLPYAELYRIPEADTVYRGTLRYLGWCDVMLALSQLGYFSLDERPDLLGKTLRQVTAELVEYEDTLGLEQRLAEVLNISPNSGVMVALKWLGLAGDAPIEKGETLLDVLLEQMLTMMTYREHERDMVVLVHEVIAAYTDRQERVTSMLIQFGTPGGHTAMARTVGLTAAIGVRLILEGKLTLTGVQIPIQPEIYEQVLPELEKLGITCAERWERPEQGGGI
jgi:saccharopine dehydrogenase-like NADP-dependent oxidoreductase